VAGPRVTSGLHRHNDLARVRRARDAARRPGVPTVPSSIRGRLPGSSDLARSGSASWWRRTRARRGSTATWSSRCRPRPCARWWRTYRRNGRA